MPHKEVAGQPVPRSLQRPSEAACSLRWERGPGRGYRGPTLDGAESLRQLARFAAVRALGGARGSGRARGMQASERPKRWHAGPAFASPGSMGGRSMDG